MKGDIAGALAALRTVPDGPKPTEKQLKSLYNMCMANGRLTEALECAELLRQMDHASLKYREFELQAYIFLGRLQEAHHCLDQIDPDANPTAFARLRRRLSYLQEVKDREPGFMALWERVTYWDAEPTQSAGSMAPLPVVQYWSQGRLPDDVAAVCGRWNALLFRLGLGPVSVFDRRLARRWISDHAPEFLPAFETAFHFAMESDIFRVAFASQSACLYLDADMWPTEQTEDLLRVALGEGASLLYARAALPSLANGLFIARPDCPFFSAVLKDCREIDLAGLPRNRQTIAETFGPGRFQTVFLRLCRTHRPEDQDLTVLRPGLLKLHLGSTPVLLASELHMAATKPPFPLAYTATDANWKRMQDAN